MNWHDKEILITGGTGSLSKVLISNLIKRYNPKGIRVFSRDELKQYEMKKKYKGEKIAFLVGDIRDGKRLELACKGVDILIHTAALKHVSTGENDPLEVVNTNILGSQNVVYAALENNIEKVVGISTDKSVYPINLYGAAKLVMERLFIQGNVYSGGRQPHFSICRYGNVMGSRGSVIPLFKEQLKTGTFTVTNPDATRFWITLEKVSQFIIDRIEDMKGGEIFIPKMPSCSISKIVKGIDPDLNCTVKIIGLTLGEKLHETLITREESRRTEIYDDYFVIGQKEIDFHNPPWRYDSLRNPIKLTDKEIQEFINGDLNE